MEVMECMFVDGEDVIVKRIVILLWYLFFIELEVVVGEICSYCL